MQPTLGQLLRAAALTFHDRPAVRSGKRELSYTRVDSEAAALAARLAELGIADGRVGVLLMNDSAFPIAIHALFRRGASALLLNPASAPREFAEQLADAGTATVLTTERLGQALPPAIRCVLLDRLPERIEVRDASGSVFLELEVGADPDPGEGAHRDRFASPGSEAAVIFTSAMSGRSRGAPLTHANLIANLRSVVAALRMTEDDRVLAALPFAHAFGFTVCLNAALASGAAVLPLPRFSPTAILDLLEAGRPTILAGVPAIFIGLLAAAEKRGVPVHTLRIAICGGAPLSLDVARRWEEAFGLPLRQGYGLTEASPVCLFNGMDHPDQPGTLGRPLPGVEVSVRGIGGEALPAGEVGEICVRGENVFGGYLGDTPRDAYFHGDWLRTGDLGSMDDGVVRFRGTLKAMFTRNGFNVYPEEIRRVLTADSRVADARAYGRPDPLRENEIVLEIRPAEGVTMTEEEVRVLCLEQLASYKQPARVIFASQTPTSQCSDSGVPWHSRADASPPPV